MTPRPIRPATPADVPALHALVERAYRGASARAGWTHEADLLDGQRTDPAALAAMLADPAQTILLMEAANQPVGSVALHKQAGGTWYLGMLTVEPAGQAAGLGRAILTAAEDWVRARGGRTIELTVIVQRIELIAWYERRGYAQTGERRPFPLDDPRFGIPRTRALAFMVMRKPL